MADETIPSDENTPNEQQNANPDLSEEQHDSLPEEVPHNLCRES